MRKCAYSQCRIPFEPRFRSTEECCSTAHAIAWARETSPERLEKKRQRAAAQERSELRREKASGIERLKSISKLLAEAQREFNRWVLQRDFGLGCVSCDVGPNYAGQWTAGHFRTTAAAPHLRFHPDNAWRQCGQCNFHKSGNLVEYRIRLVAKIGLDRVEALENDNRSSKWYRDEILEIRKEYTAKWRALRTARETKAA